MSTTAKIGIINYGLGNLGSVSSAVHKLGHEAFVSDNIEYLMSAEKLILPGVGAFGDAMRNLRSLALVEPLTHMVMELKKPILGICLGSQLMARESTEFGRHEGLGWIDASVVKMETRGLRIPHVGWNTLYQTKDDMLFDGIPKDALFYYVHSYHIRSIDPDIVIGECEYGIRFTSAIHRDNIYAIQFHPEKSQLCGLNLLNNFLARA